MLPHRACSPCTDTNYSLWLDQELSDVKSWEEQVSPFMITAASSSFAPLHLLVLRAPLNL